MQVEQLHTSSGQLVAGPLLITPQVFGDDRGFFYESWNQRRFDEAVGAPYHLCAGQPFALLPRGIARPALPAGARTPGKTGALPGGCDF